MILWNLCWNLSSFRSRAKLHSLLLSPVTGTGLGSRRHRRRSSEKEVLIQSAPLGILSHAMVWMFVSPQNDILEPNAQYDDVRRWPYGSWLRLAGRALLIEIKDWFFFCQSVYSFVSVLGVPQSYLAIHICVCIIYNFLLSQQNSPSNCVSVFSLECIATMVSISLFFRNLFKVINYLHSAKPRGLFIVLIRGCLLTFIKSPCLGTMKACLFCS